MSVSEILRKSKTKPLKVCNDLRSVLRVVEAADDIIDKIAFASDWRRKQRGPRAIGDHLSPYGPFFLHLHPDDPVIDEIEDIQCMMDDEWHAALERVEQVLKAILVNSGGTDNDMVYFDEVLTDWSPRAIMFCHERLAQIDKATKQVVVESFAEMLDTTDRRMLKVMAKRPNETLTLTQWGAQFAAANLSNDDKTIGVRAKRWRDLKYAERGRRKDGTESGHGLTITPLGEELVRNWVDPNPKEVNIRK